MTTSTSIAPTHIHLRNEHPHPLPAHLANDDVRLAESFIEYALDRFSVSGDRVLDPFAGFGTVLAVAERMGRQAWGIEIDPARVEYARTLLQSPQRLLLGDARVMGSMALPDVDLALVSPPYMCRGDPQDPLSGCVAPARVSPGRGYDTYLSELLAVFRNVGERVKPGGRIIVEVSNLKHHAQVTPLAWDLGLKLAAIFHFDGETIVTWDHYGYGYDHSYCLAYTNRPPGESP